MSRDALFIAWTGFQRRQISMAPHCGFETVFFAVPRHTSRLAKLLLYLRHGMETWKLLRARGPAVVWVQLPQVPLLWVALAYRLLSKHTVRVVADCHNAQLRPPWSNFPFARWALRRADVVLVHNDAMHSAALELGWSPQSLRVLEDVPPQGMSGPPSGLARRVIPLGKPWVVFPGSFAADEPVREVLEAARLAPELGFILTGAVQTARRNGHPVDNLPSNVVLPGFMPTDVFEDLLRDADVILGLTRFEGIQLSVCNEALGFARPLVTANTAVLRTLFGQAAVLVDANDPASIAQGCRQAFAESPARATASAQLAQTRVVNWLQGPLSAVKGLLQ